MVIKSDNDPGLIDCSNGCTEKKEDNSEVLSITNVIHKSQVAASGPFSPIFFVIGILHFIFHINPAV